MRLPYLLATVTALLGLTSQIGFAIQTINENSDHKLTSTGVVHGSSTEKHTLHKRGQHISHMTEWMYATNGNIGAYLTGGHGGTYHELWACEDGEMMSKFEVWAGQASLVGIRITFAGGKVLEAGKPEHEGTTHQSYEFEGGEILTSLSMWGDGNGTKTGAIKFTTSLDKEVIFSMENGRVLEYTYKVYSGILCGMYGWWNEDIDALGFAFLKEIKSSELRIQYSNLDNAPSHSVSLNDKQDNMGRIKMNVWNIKSWDTTDTSAHTINTKIGLTASDFWKAGTPKFDDSAEFGWSHTRTTSDEHGSLETKKSFVVMCTVPLHPLLCPGIIIPEDYIHLKFKGLWTITFNDGDSHTFNINGVYEGNSTRNAIRYPSEILTDTYTVNWQSFKPGHTPKEDNGYHGHDMSWKQFYITRNKIDDSIVPGKFGRHDSEGSFTYKSQALTTKNFEILIVPPQNLLWIPFSDQFTRDTCPRGYIEFSAGHDGKGNKYYVGRTSVGGGLNLGKTGPHMNGLEYTVLHEKTKEVDVRTTRNFDILCIRSGFQLIES